MDSFARLNKQVLNESHTPTPPKKMLNNGQLYFHIPKYQKNLKQTFTVTIKIVIKGDTNVTQLFVQQEANGYREI